AGGHVVEVGQSGEPGLERAARVAPAADHRDPDRVLRDELPALQLEPAVVLVADRVAGEVVTESRAQLDRSIARHPTPSAAGSRAGIGCEPDGPPPSMSSATAVIQLALSVRKNMIASAVSATVPARPTGKLAAYPARASSSVKPGVRASF